MHAAFSIWFIHIISHSIRTLPISFILLHTIHTVMEIQIQNFLPFLRHGSKNAAAFQIISEKLPRHNRIPIWIPNHALVVDQFIAIVPAV